MPNLCQTALHKSSSVWTGSIQRDLEKMEKLARVNLMKRIYKLNLCCKGTWPQINSRYLRLNHSVRDGECWLTDAKFLTSLNIEKTKREMKRQRKPCRIFLNITFPLLTKRWHLRNALPQSSTPHSGDDSMAYFHTPVTISEVRHGLNILRLPSSIMLCDRGQTSG